MTPAQMDVSPNAPCTRRTAAGCIYLPRTARRITSVVTPGCEVMTTCDAPLTSVTLAFARLAIVRRLPVPIVLSMVGTTAQEGIDVQAGAPDGSPSVTSEAGRCETAITAANLRGRSAANTS